MARAHRQAGGDSSGADMDIGYDVKTWLAFWNGVT
jgi:hypothetical protein